MLDVKSVPAIERKRVPKVWHFGAWATTALSAITAVIYLSAELRMTGGLVDWVFVVALLVNSSLVGVAGVYLHGKAVDLFEMFPDTGHRVSGPEKIFGSIFNLVIGLVFAAALSCLAFMLSPWEDKLLDHLVFALLFSANVQIGIGFGALWSFWTYSRRSLQSLELRILNLSRPDIVAFIDLVSATVTLVGLLCTIAVSSLLFSKFEINSAIFPFSVFSLLVVVASYFVPLCPLVIRLRAVKFQELDRIERRIDDLYRQAPTHNSNAGDLAVLLNFREVVRRTHVLPPNGQFSLLTAVSAVVLSFLPTLVQKMLAVS